MKIIRQPLKSPYGSGINNQGARFTDAARRLGADEDEAAFKAKLAQIARQKAKEEVPAPPKGRSGD